MGLGTVGHNSFKCKRCLDLFNFFSVQVNTKLQGISDTCGRSEEYLLPPIGVQIIVPPLAKNREQIRDIFFRTWPKMVSSLSTATVYRSASLNGYLSHEISSPIDASHKS